MTELLYQTDSYLKEFEATVTAVMDDGAVVLDRTAFFPGGGGQLFDVGELLAGPKRWSVTRARKKGADVMHTLAEESPAVGTRVTGRLDWERRYKLMRTHTAMHILCGVIWPVEQMPDYLQWISKVLPLTYAVNGLRDMMLAGKGLADVLFELSVLIGFAAIMSILAALTLRRGSAG